MSIISHNWQRYITYDITKRLEALLFDARRIGGNQHANLHILTRSNLTLLSLGRMSEAAGLSTCISLYNSRQFRQVQLDQGISVFVFRYIIIKYTTENIQQFVYSRPHSIAWKVSTDIVSCFYGNKICIPIVRDMLTRYLKLLLPTARLPHVIAQAFFDIWSWKTVSRFVFLVNFIYDKDSSVKVTKLCAKA